MKSFLKYLLATILGIIISSVILILILAGIVGSVFSDSGKPAQLKENSILYLTLDQPIVDRKSKTPFDFSAFNMNQQTGLNDILNCISKAKDDANIAGIHLDLTYMSVGAATLEEIRNAILEFKESGKFVTIYSEMLSQSAYYLATAADKIYFNPYGFFIFRGMSAQGVFFKKSLEKLDIEPTLIRYGSFKSAGEMFTEEKYSENNRKQLHQLISCIWNDVCSGISKERNIPVEKLNEIADKLLIKDANDALELGFFDSLIYKDQVISILKEKTGIEESKDLNTVTLEEYSKILKHKNQKNQQKDKIAILYASGDIVSGKGNDDMISSERFGKEIRKIRRDSSIKALVIRVNSPGGDAIASEAICHEIALTRKVKPVVVSMGDVAASGGYYISCVADSVLTQNNTVTGSIGVFVLFLNTKGLFNKAGITFDNENTNEYADFMSAVRPLKPEEIKYWQYGTDQIYKTFVNRVSEGRKLSPEKVDSIGQGRVWSGTDAIQIGLADKIGGLQEAVRIARRMAKLDEKYSIVELPEQEEPLQKIIRDLSENSKVRIIQNILGTDFEYSRTLKRMIEHPGVMTRMPIDITIE